MRRELARVLVALACAVAPTGCHRGAGSSSTCKVDAETVACVDGVALSRKYAEQFVQEPWWVPGSSVLPDARRQAVDRAVRTELFRAEARRRGLSLAKGIPDVPASWAQALIVDEMTKRGLSREAISDDEATHHYEQNKELFNQVDEVEAQVIAFDSPKKAEQVWAEAQKTDAAGFTALVAAHSIDEKTKAKGGVRKIIAAPDEDRAMLKMALSVRRPGVVAGPFKTADGRFWLLRITTSPIEHAKPLDDVLRTTVKNAMLDERRRKLVDELDASLRASHKIELFDVTVAKIAVPEFS